MIRTPIIRTIFGGPLEVPIMEAGLYMENLFQSKDRELPL